MGMISPFPGMDPYLERHWGDVHHSLIQYTRDALQPGLPADLLARVEERIYLETGPGVSRRVVPDVHVAQLHGPSPPMALREDGGGALAEPEVFEVLDEPITEGYLEIRERDGGKVITVIEFISPANKLGGVGQQKYLEKQEQVLRSDASLVEIDLVRTGQRVLALPNNQIPDGRQAGYLACISPGWHRTRREPYAMPFRQRLPVLPIPLGQTDRVLPLELQKLLDQAYAAGRYDVIDYCREPEPPLPPEHASWAADLLKAAGRR
jgi:hypothetical protein